MKLNGDGCLAVSSPILFDFPGVVVPSRSVENRAVPQSLGTVVASIRCEFEVPGCPILRRTTPANSIVEHLGEGGGCERAVEPSLKQTLILASGQTVAKFVGEHQLALEQ